MRGTTSEVVRAFLEGKAEPSRASNVRHGIRKLDGTPILLSKDRHGEWEIIFALKLGETVYLADYYLARTTNIMLNRARDWQAAAAGRQLERWAGVEMLREYPASMLARTYAT